MNWRALAYAAINAVDSTLPADASLAERTKAIDAAYPFGERAYHPYKVWLDCRREYLSRHGYQPERKALPTSPLERLMARGGRK